MYFFLRFELNLKAELIKNRGLNFFINKRILEPSFSEFTILNSVSLTPVINGAMREVTELLSFDIWF